MKSLYNAYMNLLHLDGCKVDLLSLSKKQTIQGMILLYFYIFSDLYYSLNICTRNGTFYNNNASKFLSGHGIPGFMLFVALGEIQSYTNRMLKMYF